MSKTGPSFEISTGTGVLVIILVIVALFAVLHDRDGGLSEARIADSVKSGDVVLFSSTSCQYCKMARDLFDARQVPYRELNIDDSEKARALFQALGGRGVPLIFIGELRIDGYDRRTIESAIRELQSI